MNWQIVLAFVLYMGLMIGIGAYFYGKNQTSAEYILGGRKLGGWVAAMSAQASDMSGWLLMGLPGAVYAAGTGQIWIGVGLALGTFLNWMLVASRLRRYTIVAGDSLTLPEYFENRFHDKSRILKTASAVVITIFFLVYTASGFVAGAKLFHSVFGIDYQYSLIVGAAIILIYTFLGGFSAVCWTDFIQGLLMLAAILTVPIAAVFAMGGFGEVGAQLHTMDPQFLNPFTDGDKPITFISLVSQLAWGLGYFGMPHILVRFMAIRSNREVKKSRRIAIVWVVISLLCAVLIGLAGKLYLDLPPASSESVFIEMVKKMFSGVPFISGILLCAILAAIMSTADSQLLVTSSAVTNDLYKGIINRKASDKLLVWMGRIVVVVVAVIAYFIARDPESSVMALVSNAWAGFGSAFGPVVLFSLFWKRTTLNGAVSGIISGAAVVIVWEYVKFGSQTLSQMTGVYSIIPGFLIACILIVAVSLMGKAPDESVMEEFRLAMEQPEEDGDPASVS